MRPFTVAVSSVLCRRTACRATPRGFALIVVITVLAFLVLLVVALAALTRVETQVATNTENLAKARQNALTALNIAVGQLQKYAGPDQRVTARADLVNLGPIGDAGGNRNPHWTGVWDSTNVSAGPIAWLISGNEGDPLGTEPDADMQRLAGTLQPYAIAANGTFLNVGTIRLVGGGSSALLNLGGAFGSGANAETGQVIVPAVPISTDVNGLGADQASGRMAYWIGDEGVKADIAATFRDPAIEPAPFDTEPTAREQRFALAPPGASGEIVDSDFDRLVGNWQRVTSRSQLPLPEFAPGSPQLPVTRTRASFHSITAGTYGLQTNPVTGGLKVDLSHDSAFDGTGADLGNALATVTGFDASYRSRLYDYARIVPNTAFGAAAGSHPQSTIAPSARLAPVLTEVRLIIGLKFPAQTPGPLPDPQTVQVRGWATFALHNPYVATFEPAEYRVRITDLPTLGPTAPAQPWRANGLTLGTFALNGNLFPTTLDLETPLRALPAGVTALFGAALAAGEVTDGVPQLGSPHYSATTTGTVDATRLSHDFDIVIPAAPPATANVGVELQWNDGGTWTTISSTTFALGLVAVPSATVAADAEVFLVLGARKGDDPVGDWPAADPREPGLPPANWDFDTAFPDYSDHLDTTATHVYSGSGTSVASAASLAAGFTGGGATVAAGGSPVTILFDLPAVAPTAHGIRVTSLGELRHARLPGAPAWHLGSFPGLPTSNATLTTLNEALLDRFFFSGYDQADKPTAAEWIAGAPSAQPRVLPMRTQEAFERYDNDTLGTVTASTVLVRGAFNVNSTSTEAWAALLQSAFGHDPRVIIPSAAGAGGGLPHSTASPWANTLHSAFPRFAHHGGYGFYDLNDGSGTTRRSPWHNGYRELAPLAGDEVAVPGLTEPQAHALALRIADAIRRRLRARAEPFASLADFANSGLLQEAINNDSDLATPALDLFWNWPSAGANADEDPSLNLPTPAWPPQYPVTNGLNQMHTGGTWGAIPEGVPSYLSQADIIAALQPLLSVRSDTFLVRAYGETINPATGESTGRAWCEATVQRFPEYVEPAADDPEDTPAPGSINDRFGRRFKIVSFRWLTENDI